MSIFTAVKSRVMEHSRKRKLDHFYSLCRSNSNILDVGVSNNEHNSSINIFLNKFRLDPRQYTGLGVENLSDIAKKNPDKHFVEYPGGVFPFADQEFDWIFSNAVIEHVGDHSDQLLFVNEMLRVARNVFFTTPNKFFPVESHTNVFFRHWRDDTFYEWCRKNSSFWSKNNLLLLGISDIINLMKISNAKEYSIVRNRSAGWTMTFTIICSHSDLV